MLFRKIASNRNTTLLKAINVSRSALSYNCISVFKNTDALRHIIVSVRIFEKTEKKFFKLGIQKKF